MLIMSLNFEEIWKLLRPKHWVKNVFILMPAIFAGSTISSVDYLRTVLGVVLFSILSSAVYIINDIIDLERDKEHSINRNRPIPSGKVKPVTAFILALVLLLIFIAFSRFLPFGFLYTGLSYFIINIFYSFLLKKLVLIDIFVISFGFVLRIISGIILISTPITHWIILPSFFLSLFLGFAKRREELILLGESAEKAKEVLRHYDRQMLNSYLSITASLSIVFYALFTISDYAIAKYGTANLIYTLPFVTYGFFRYYYLISNRYGGKAPTEILFLDLPIIFNVTLWALSVVLILNIG